MRPATPPPHHGDPSSSAPPAAAALLVLRPGLDEEGERETWGKMMIACMRGNFGGGWGEQMICDRAMYQDRRSRLYFPTQLRAFISSREKESFDFDFFFLLKKGTWQCRGRNGDPKKFFPKIVIFYYVYYHKRSLPRTNMRLGG
jgi:hypothetical protein